jgi:uncharacterized protein
MSVSDHLVVRLRWVILAAFAVVCAWLVPGIGQLRHDDDVLAFLPPDHADVITFREVADRFGMLDVALVGLRAEDGGNLLVTERVERIRALANEIETAPGVRLVLSFPDLPDATVQGDTLVVNPLVPKGTTDASEIASRVLGNGNAVGNLISNDGRAAALMIYVMDDARAGGSSRGEQLDTIRAMVEDGWSGDTFFGGGPFVEHEAASASRKDIERLSPVVIAVLALASALLLGSITGAALNLLVTGLGVALVVGAHGRFDEPFTIVSSTTPVMMVALGGAFGMHVISGYRRQAGSSAARASAALRELWLPVVLSGITTATAFFALVVMPQVPMKRFGVVAGSGVLLLLVLALLVLPALASFLPTRWLSHRPVRHLRLPFLPPLWLMAALAVGGIALGTQLQADPDTTNVFAEDSEPRRADRFFNEHFGGSQFVQIAIEADLAEPTVLRAIRDLADAVARIEGVADVRSLIEPVAMLTEGFGGRDGIPQTPGQARRVIDNLADQAPMAQLMTTDTRGAIVHVKLAPADGAAQVRVTDAIRDAVAAMPQETIRVGSTEVLATRQAQRAQVRERVGRLVGRALDEAEFTELLEGVVRSPALLDEVAKLRDRAFGTDELVDPVPASEYEAIDPATLLEPRGAALEQLIVAELPTLNDSDPEGIPIAADQLGRWIDEARHRHRVDAMCETLELATHDPDAPQAVEPQPDPDDPFAEDVVSRPGGPCGRLLVTMSELEDEQWAIPAGVGAEAVREVPIRTRLTGQPLIGQAFADSVTHSLRTSTLVSLGALFLVLLMARNLFALVPATWTLAVTAGIITLLGHPIGVGTSMVSCIALGAGVDFAIHLGFRARRAHGPHPGQEATDALGMVILVTGVQLALAFCVLLASSMPPLRQFGGGLAIGLLGAAAGAVWLTPRLFRRADGKRA